MCYANLNSQLGNDSMSYHFRLSFNWRNWIFERNIFFFNLQFQELPFYELAIMCGLGAYWSVRGKKCSKMALKDNFEIFKSRTNKKWMNATASCQNSAIFFFKSIIFYSKVIVKVWWKSAVMITITLIQNVFHKWFF